MRPEVTILLPTFNRRTLLERAVKSVLQQSHSNWRLLVLDNCSTDGTRDFLKAIAQKDRRIIYVRHKQNIGMMPNYAYGFSKIKTPFFSMLSDDDFLLPNFLELAISNLKGHKDAAFFSGDTIVVDEKFQIKPRPLVHWHREGYFNKIEAAGPMAGMFLLPPGILFRTSVLKTVKPDWRLEIQARWDSDFLYRIVAQNAIIIAKIPVAGYFAHSGGMGTDFFKKGVHTVEGAKKFDTVARLMLENVGKIKGLKARTKSELQNILRKKFALEARQMAFAALGITRLREFIVLLNLTRDYDGLSRLTQLQYQLAKWGARSQTKGFAAAALIHLSELTRHAKHAIRKWRLILLKAQKHRSKSKIENSTLRKFLADAKA